MQNNYEAPELTLIGRANEIVMGSGTSGVDLPHFSEPDFEFEQD